MNVVVLDTGCANLNSVKAAIARHGYEPVVSRDPDVVLRADKLFLPGVGTAQAAMDQIHERDLVELIKACTQPVLGICLGMQLLGRRSEETNGVDLLGIIDQDVPKMTDHGLPLPHMGWNRVYPKAGDRLFRGIEDGAYFTSFTATRCRSMNTPSRNATTVKRLPPQYRKITFTACSFTPNAPARRAHSC
ncbi:imidazole glycerol phosphate synthase subunit [Escherichia coli]|nr:imidazole glycerol phosphate synthase subunit [Escherichia coli]